MNHCSMKLELNWTEINFNWEHFKCCGIYSSIALIFSIDFDLVEIESFWNDWFKTSHKKIARMHWNYQTDKFVIIRVEL